MYQMGYLTHVWDASISWWDRCVSYNNLWKKISARENQFEHIPLSSINTYVWLSLPLSISPILYLKKGEERN